MAAPLTFEEFRSSRKRVADLASVRDDASGPGLIYVPGPARNDNLFIEGPIGDYSLTIENQSWTNSDLDDLEMHLYAYYVGECDYPEERE